MIVSERSQVLVCVCVCVCVIRYHLSDTRISSFQTKNNIDDVAKREKFTPIPRITMHHCVKTHPPMHILLPSYVSYIYISHDQIPHITRRSTMVTRHRYRHRHRHHPTTLMMIATPPLPRPRPRPFLLFLASSRLVRSSTVIGCRIQISAWGSG